MTVTASSKCFDNTRLSTYKECPRKYYLRHVLHWTRDTTADALVFGSSWHAGMDALWAHGKQYGPIDLANLAYDGFMQKWEEEGFSTNITMELQESLGARTPGNAKEMFFNYATARSKILKEADVLAIEQPFAVPIPDMPDTWYIGKLDKVVQWNQNKVIIEHKTTSDYAINGGIQPRWMDQWYSSSQVKGYEFGGGLYYPNLDGVWVDGALVHKKVHNVFKFIPIQHSTPLLLEWIEDTRNWIGRVNADSSIVVGAGKLIGGVFPKNEDQCFGKYGNCPFLDICRNCADPTQLDGPPEGYKEEKWEPFETLGLDKLISSIKG